jgi:hypothetical protein
MNLLKAFIYIVLLGVLIFSIKRAVDAYDAYTAPPVQELPV